MTSAIVNPINPIKPYTMRCDECGFTTRDQSLMDGHSCGVQANGGRCEDFPACGHEWGDCNGLRYGSDAAIQADPHLLCDHNTGFCEVWDAEQPDEDQDDETDDPVEH